MGTFIDLSGTVHGRLTIVDRAENDNTGQVMWNCRCSCGNIKVARAGDIKAGKTLSCGCLMREVSTSTGKANKKHGMRQAPEYNTWRSMKKRCIVKTHKSYNDYGGRGITICDRWLESFENFYGDMGDRPSKGHSLDRINNEKGYYPENCRWADRRTQVINQRKLKGCSSQFRGVSKIGEGWRASLCYKGAVNYLGRFKSEEAAAKVYDNKARELGYEEAWLNFPK